MLSNAYLHYILAGRSMDNVGVAPIVNIADTVALGVSFYPDKAGQSKGLEKLLSRVRERGFRFLPFHPWVWLIPYRYPRTSSTLETIKISSA